MSNILKKSILLIIILGIFLLPISPSLEIQKTEAVQYVEAVTQTTITANIFSQTDDSVTYDIVARADDPTQVEGFSDFRHLFVMLYEIPSNRSVPADTDTHISGVRGINVPNVTTVAEFKTKHTIDGLSDGKKYYVLFILTDRSYNPDGLWIQRKDEYKDIKEFVEEKLPYLGMSFVFDKQNQDNTSGSQNIIESSSEVAFDFDCGITNLEGCVAQLIFVVWKLSAWFARLGGQFLDFLIYYSTDSGSYKNGFITEGWGAVRDIVNIFFIIALLYIAIKTILSLNTSNNKKLISYIIIIALIINFSLFVTKVVIDSSNILAKVFYNNISAEQEGQVSVTGAKGEKSISAGLVSKFNPQKMLTQDFYNNSTGTFIFVTIISILITFYAGWIFFSVGLLFVGRVVALWLAMIFSPIAFVSYTLPFDIPGFGHKEWWSELLKNAFLAPIFVFLLYIIIMFAGFLSKIVIYEADATLIQKIMSVIIPFIILAVLLTKAKEMAVKYSGELGKMISKVGAFVGGAAVGLATGGAAMALRGTIGRAGSAIANSERVKKWEKEGKFGAATLRNVSKKAGSGSMDIRGVKIAGKDLASTGLKVNTLGKQKEGGFEKAKTDKIEKRVKRAKELETGEGSKEKRKASNLEADLRAKKAEKATELATAEKAIASARQDMEDAAKADPTGVLAKVHFDKLQDAKIKKIELEKEITLSLADKIEIKNGTKTSGDFTATAGSIADIEKQLNKTNDEINAKEIAAMNDYAKDIKSWSNKTINYITSFGQHSGAGANIAADRIRKGVKIEETKK